MQKAALEGQALSGDILSDVVNKQSIRQKEEYEKILAENANLRKQNDILKANISSLFKTAVAEIDRKNTQLKELQTRLDDIVLRRHRNHQERDHYDRRSHSVDSRSRSHHSQRDRR